MQPIIHFVTSFNQLIATAILLGFVFLLQAAGGRWINSLKFRSNTYRRRWIVGLRNLRLLILTIGLILIWATELRTAALSAVAIMAALVIGTKELIMCLLGSIIKAGSNAFSLGDRIRVGTLEGDVIDQSLLSTQLQEVRDGQFTGDRISIPNSLFLNQAIHNSTLPGGNAAFGIVTIKLNRKEDWSRHEDALLQAAQAYCQQSSDRIKKIVDKLRKEGVDLPDTQPRTLLRFEDKDTLTITLRYPSSTESKLAAEQEILRNYLKITQTESTAATTEDVAS